MKADEVLDRYCENAQHGMDANDVLYAIESSRDYDPARAWRIAAPLTAVNFADDLINPPELGVLEREIVKVKHGKAVLVPMSDGTRGHGARTQLHPSGRGTSPNCSSRIRALRERPMIRRLLKPSLPVPRPCRRPRREGRHSGPAFRGLCVALHGYVVGAAVV